MFEGRKFKTHVPENWQSNFPVLARVDLTHLVSICFYLLFFFLPKHGSFAEQMNLFSPQRFSRVLGETYDMGEQLRITLY